MTKEVYVYLTEVPKDKKGEIIPNKRYKVENCGYNKSIGCYTGNITVELSYSWYILTKGCAHLGCRDWGVEVIEIEETKPLTKEEARKILNKLEFECYFTSPNKDEGLVMHDTSYTKSELEAILTLWEEL